MSTQSQPAQPLHPLVADLRARALRLRAQAIVFLMMLVGVIAGALYLYVQAPDIAQGSQHTFSMPDQKDMEKRVDFANKLRRGSALIRECEEASLKSGSDESPEVCRRSREVTIEWTNMLVGHFGTLGAKRPSADDVLADTVNRLWQAVQNVQNPMLQSETFVLETVKFRFYSTALTRVGAVLMLIFLAGFLINVYRYTFRLSASYDSRADALILLWHVPEGQRWASGEAARKFMSVDDHSFDRVKSPSKEVLEMAKALVAMKEQAKKEGVKEKR